MCVFVCVLVYLYAGVNACEFAGAIVGLSVCLRVCVPVGACMCMCLGLFPCL